MYYPVKICAQLYILECEKHTLRYQIHFQKYSLRNIYFFQCVMAEQTQTHTMLE